MERHEIEAMAGKIETTEPTSEIECLHFILARIYDLSGRKEHTMTEQERLDEIRILTEEALDVPMPCDLLCCNPQ